MIYPLVADLADEGIPVALTCRVLGFSKQAYYAWKANPVSQRDWDDVHLLNTAISTPRSTSTTTTLASATDSSPTSSPATASSPVATA